MSNLLNNTKKRNYIIKFKTKLAIAPNGPRLKEVGDFELKTSF
jgi:hypothetical protein